jgi:hypothetical protein
MNHGTQVIDSEEIEMEDLLRRQDKKSRRTSEDIAQEIEGSVDAIKIIELSKELHEAMLEEERQKVKNRLGRIAKISPSRSHRN